MRMMQNPMCFSLISHPCVDTVYPVYVWIYEPENCTFTHVRILLCILSDTYVYAFAESPGVRVCHADYALDPATVLCNAMHIV